MATIKSFTDLSQSKTLSKILPLESADYTHLGKDEDNVLTRPYFESCSSELKEWVGKDEMHPCWSLAVLIKILPRSIEFKGDKYYHRFMKEYVEYANDEISITGRCLHTTGNDNLVDACYEMIIKLHELNLL